MLSTMFKNGSVAKAATRRAASCLAQLRCMSQTVLRVDNPYTLTPEFEVELDSAYQLENKVVTSAKVQKEWHASTSLEDRISVCKAFLDNMDERKSEIALEITRQMGKTIRMSRGEINCVRERAEAMMSMAEAELADEVIEDSENAYRAIKRQPVGVVLVMAPWNYPLMTAINSIIPAILAGNSVLVKHSPRTPLCANHFADVMDSVTGAPNNLITALHCDHESLRPVIQRPEVGYCQFTGSVTGGHIVYEQVSKRFVDVGLELGGKDAAYVREDADVEAAAEGLVDGAMFNAGQSCCSVERIYVHESVYEKFIEKAKSEYILGDPQDSKTTMTPLAQPGTDYFLLEQVEEAREKGARIVTGGKPTTDANGKGRFFLPTIAADCTHEMSIMTRESFGPVVAVTKVRNDEEALRLMNDSKYGLTGSIWTKDEDRARSMGSDLQVGTVFLNRCDVLDPYLPWTGVRDSGKGYSLSRHGFRPMVRLQGYNFNK